MELKLRCTLPADIPYVLGLEREDANCPFIVPWPEERHRAVEPAALGPSIPGRAGDALLGVHL